MNTGKICRCFLESVFAVAFAVPAFATNGLENKPDIIFVLIDSLRSDPKTSWAEMGKGRSETFIEYLEDVKKTCTSCSNQLGA